MGPVPSIELTPGRWIGEHRPCYLVAEAGQNHNGQMAIARRLIDGVADSGADAVKFCKRHLPSDLTHEASLRGYHGQQSFAATYGEHRKALELSPGQFADLKEYAESKRLTFFATACDMKSVDDLEAINVPFYKIASRDLTNLPLLEYVAVTGKPIILSCGMDGLDEISQALDAIRMHHERIVLLQCTSAYPTAHEDVNLKAMQTLRREFDVLVGLSDHSFGLAAPIAAAALGAVLIEKHVTLSCTMKGTDHACSLELAELNQMAGDIRNVERAMGDGVKRVPASVQTAQAKLGRSVVSRCNIPQGTQVTEDMLCLKSAGEGLSWFDRKKLIGKTARRTIGADQRLSAADVE